MRYTLSIAFILSLCLAGCGPIGKTRAEIESGPMKHYQFVSEIPEPKPDHYGTRGFGVLEYKTEFDEFDLQGSNYHHVTTHQFYTMQNGKVVGFTWTEETSHADQITGVAAGWRLK